MRTSACCLAVQAIFPGRPAAQQLHCGGTGAPQWLLHEAPLSSTGLLPCWNKRMAMLTGKPAVPEVSPVT